MMSEIKLRLVDRRRRIYHNPAENKYYIKMSHGLYEVNPPRRQAKKKVRR